MNEDKSYTDKAGRPPGEVVFVGRRRVDAPTIDLIRYTPDNVTQANGCKASDACRGIDRNSVSWINVTGIHDTELIKEFGNLLGLHPLTCEDVANTAHRPKMEEFPEYIFLVMKMIIPGTSEGGFLIEHVSLLLGEGYVVSFQEKEGDVFDRVRQRIVSGGGRIRKSGSDYLAYALMDSIVDNYFVALESVSDYIEELDDRIVSGQEPSLMKEIHRLKRNIILLRKAVWPMREEISSLEKCESELIAHDTSAFLRDLYDHTIQVIDIVETQRDLLGGMHDTYLTAISNRMNDIMKVLTIIATVFIPLTFIAGVYGMNFLHMPELRFPWAYPVVLVLMLLVALVMLVFFRRKKWL